MNLALTLLQNVENKELPAVEADDLVSHILEVAIIIRHVFIDIRILLEISIMSMLKISSIIDNIKKIALKMNMYVVIEITEYLEIEIVIEGGIIISITKISLIMHQIIHLIIHQACLGTGGSRIPQGEEPPGATHSDG